MREARTARDRRERPTTCSRRARRSPRRTRSASCTATSSREPVPDARREREAAREGARFRHLEGVGPGRDDALTEDRRVMGSPQYMSPEQMRSTRDVDPRTDIWSLGVCLVRAAHDAGSLRFAGVRRALRARPEGGRRRFARSAPSSRGGWSGDRECLEKDPGNRFSTVWELAAALEPYAPAACARAPAFASPPCSAPCPVRLRSPRRAGQRAASATARARASPRRSTRDRAPRAAASRRRSECALVGGASLLVVLAIVGGVLAVRALRGPAARQPVQYEPDVASLGAASPRQRRRTPPDAGESAATVVPAVPTSGAVGSQVKVRPPASAKPKAVVGPAERF